MTDLLAQGAAWLEAQRHAHCTSAVAYVRGEASVDLLATIGRTIFEQSDAYGIVERTEARDFLVRAEDLVLDGAVALPERGDRVRETVGAQVLVYEVMAPGNEPHYRYSDAYRWTLRIHTKHVDTEEAS